jgi:DNA-binding IscR family transcriptional regulator
LSASSEVAVSIVKCVNSTKKCDNQSHCGVRTIWQRLNENIRNMMNNVTLEEILQSYPEQDAADSFEDHCI